MDAALLSAAGLLSGIIAGLLGVGGGTILVPVLVFLGRTTHVAIGTSTFAMIITTLSGSIQNWRAGDLSLREVVPVALASVVAAQAGAFAAESLPARTLALSFAALLLTSPLLMVLRSKLAGRDQAVRDSVPLRGLTGLCGGFLSGVFGVGGGVIMVPLLILFLGDPIHRAVRVSLAVIVLTAASGAVAHFVHSNVDFTAGFILGGGGLIGAQIGTRLLRVFPEKILRTGFVLFTFALAAALVYKATIAGID